MPLISVTTGTYLVYLGNSLNWLGILDENGVEITWTTKAHLIDKSDSYADTFINGFHTGCDFRMHFICKEFPWDINALEGNTSLDATWPAKFDTESKQWFNARVFNQAFGFIMPTIGGEFNEQTFPVVLNAIPGTLQLGQSFTVLTALKAHPRPNQSRSFNLTSKIRTLPVDLDLMPYMIEGGPLSGFNAWFTVA